MNSKQTSPIPQWRPRQIVTATLFVVAVSLAFWLLFRYRLVLLILFIAVVLGTALRPMVDWLGKRGISRPYGLSLVYVMLLTAVSGLLFLLVPIIIEQSLALGSSLPGLYQNFRSFLFNSSSILLWNLGYNLPAELGSVWDSGIVDEQSLDAVGRFMGFAATFLSGFFVVGAVFLLTSFWILESDRTVRGLLFYLPQPLRQQAQDLFISIEERVGAFVRGQLILSGIIGAIALVAYLLIGLPNALVLAVIAGIFEAVPVIGPTLGAVPAILVAFSLDPNLVFWVIIATIIIQVSENYLIVPRVMGASVGVHPMMTLLILATFTSLLGLPGALLAIPSAAVFQLFVDRFLLSKAQVTMESPQGRDIRSALRYDVQALIEDIRKQLRQKDDRSDADSDQLEDAIESLALELDLVLRQESAGEEKL